MKLLGTDRDFFVLRTLFTNTNFMATMMFPCLQAVIFMSIKAITKQFYRKSKSRIIENIVFRYLRFMWDEQIISWYKGFFLFELITNTYQYAQYLLFIANFKMTHLMGVGSYVELVVCILVNLITWLYILRRVRGKAS